MLEDRIFRRFFHRNPNRRRVENHQQDFRVYGRRDPARGAEGLRSAARGGKDGAFVVNQTTPRVRLTLGAAATRVSPHPPPLPPLLVYFSERWALLPSLRVSRL